MPLPHSPHHGPMPTSSYNSAAAFSAWPMPTSSIDLSMAGIPISGAYTQAVPSSAEARSTASITSSTDETTTDPKINDLKNTEAKRFVETFVQYSNEGDLKRRNRRQQGQINPNQTVHHYVKSYHRTDPSLLQPQGSQVKTIIPISAFGLTDDERIL